MNSIFNTVFKHINISNLKKIRACAHFIKLCVKQIKNCEIYIVGGAVRDAIIGRDINDIDLTTNLQLDQLTSAFGKLNLWYFIKSKQYSTICVKWGSYIYEITPYRFDIEPSGRHTKIAPASSLKEDLKRRDFTFNALALDTINFKLIDISNGYNDLLARNVRFVGRACDRIKEDKLRAYRFVRFMLLVKDPYLSYKVHSINLKQYWNSISLHRKLEEYDKCIPQLTSKYLLLLIKEGYFGNISVKSLNVLHLPLKYIVPRLYDIDNKLQTFLISFNVQRDLKSELLEKIKLKIESKLYYLLLYTNNTPKRNEYLNQILPWYNNEFMLLTKIHKKINKRLIFSINGSEIGKIKLKFIILQEYWKSQKRNNV